jgi:hypothetical protein
VTAGLPQYAPSLVDRLFPPTPYGINIQSPALTPRTPDAVIPYDTAKFPFDEIVRKVIAPALRELNQLHTAQTVDNVGIQLRSAAANPLNGSISEFHDLFYRRLNEADGWPEFMDTFKRYVREVIMPLFPEAEELVYVCKYLLYKSY